MRAKTFGRIVWTRCRPSSSAPSQRGDLRADTDARLLLEMLIAPIHGRLLLTGEAVDDGLAERLVEMALNGAAAASGQL